MKLFTTSIVALTLAPSLSQAALTTIEATGWDYDIVYGNGEEGQSINGNMDSGAGYLGASWYEQGRNTNAPLTGLPNSTIISESTPDLYFSFQPFAGDSNAILLSESLNGDLVRNEGKLTLSTPSAFTRIALIGSTGNAGDGSGITTATVNYEDGTSQLFSDLGAINLDWFGGSPIAYNANGRSANLEEYNNVNNGQPRLYETFLTLDNTSSNVLSIDFIKTGPGNTAIMAISGEAVPEPSAIAFLAAAGLFGFARRRRA